MCSFWEAESEKRIHLLFNLMFVLFPMNMRYHWNLKLDSVYIIYKRATRITNVCVMKAKVTTSESQSNLPLFWVHQGTQQMNAIPGECKSGIRLLCVEFCPPTKKKKNLIHCSSNPQYLRMWPYLRQSLYKGNWVKMRSLGWILIWLVSLLKGKI